MLDYEKNNIYNNKKTMKKWKNYKKMKVKMKKYKKKV